MSFARRVAAGEDIRKAALSTAGNVVVQRLQRQGVNVLGAVPGGAAARAAMTTARNQIPRGGAARAAFDAAAALRQGRNQRRLPGRSGPRFLAREAEAEAEAATVGGTGFATERGRAMSGRWQQCGGRYVVLGA